MSDDGPRLRWTPPVPSPDQQPPAQLPEHQRLSEVAAVHVVGALAKHARGERLTWDVALDLMPTPTGPSPVVVLYLTLPNPLLGAGLFGELVIVEPKNVTLDGIDREVGAAVERLRRQRSASLAATN